MKKSYAVGFVSFFDNELKVSFVKAESEEDAMRQVLAAQGWKGFENEDDLREFAFSGDAAIDAKLVPVRSKKA